ncbi:ABC transporter substrate-binding protein [Pseudomonas putida]|nr:ABC transporter substrate-binding protein [Pseudomonas putida]
MTSKNNKKTKYCLSVFALSAVGLSSAFASPTITPGVLSAGTDLTLPPYTYLDNGKPSGFDPEFISKLAEHMGASSSFVDTRFASLIIGVKGNRYDVVASDLYITPERAKVVDFIPYFSTGGALMVKTDNVFKPVNLAESCGKKVASIKGAAWISTINSTSAKECTAQGKSAITIQEYDTSSEAAQAVISGAVDAQYEDIAIASMIAQRSTDRLVISSKETLDPIVSGLAIKQDNLNLKNAINEAFSKMKASGEYHALLSKYNLIEPTEQQVAKALGK